MIVNEQNISKKFSSDLERKQYNNYMINKSISCINCCESGYISRLSIKKANRQRGFTLIEIMVVIIIVGLLSALVAPKFFGKVDQAKIKTTKTQIELLGSALDSFRLDVGRYPTSEEGLNALRENPGDIKNWDGPYLPKPVPKDAWENDFNYISPGEHGQYDLFSYGADNAQGGEDKMDKDIVSWE